MCIVTDGSERDIPEPASQISFNGVSRVWRYGGFVYKRSTPFLTNNDYYFLELLQDSGYVPGFLSRFDKYTIKMEDLGKNQTVTNKGVFVSHMREIHKCLIDNRIRHGDLTRYAIVVRSNKPHIVDFAESRFADDPRPDKRPEGDAYWIERTIDDLTKGM
jgi:RIO-like serine/threonine protein kinase